MNRALPFIGTVLIAVTVWLAFESTLAFCLATVAAVLIDLYQRRNDHAD